MNSILLRIADAWHRRTVLAKLFSFASIGVVNVAVDVSVFTLSFQFLHLPLIASNIVAWLIAVTGSYAMNTKITFGRETGGALSIGRYLRFATSGIFGVIVATTVLVLLSRYTNVPVAKLGSIIAGFGVNFSISHFIVFRGRKSAPVGISM
jgi:putative flippase GtrA